MQVNIVFILTFNVFCVLQSLSAMNCPLLCTCISSKEGIRIMCSANNNIEARQILQMPLPYNTSSLHVVFLPDATQVNFSFCNNLTEAGLIELRLEGHTNISPWTLEKEHLSCFRKLRVLQLCDTSITAIQIGILSNMSFLEEFDVSRNRDLVIEHVIFAFENSTVPKLKIFNISMIHSREDMNLIIMGHEFFNIFKETDLKILDISWTRAFLLTVPIAYYIPNVEVINMTGTFLTGNSDCMSSGLRLENLRHMECNNWPYVIKSKRSIRSSIYPSCNSSYAGMYLHDNCYNIPPGLTVMYMRNINMKYVYFSFSSEMCFNPSNVLKFLSLRGLGWPSERPFTVFKGLLRLENFDLSGSSLEIISSETFRYMAFLKYLDLSSNKLHKIDATSFALNGKLSMLDLSRNRFENFPLTMVSNNVMLTTLNLSQNALKSFKLNLTINFSLATIDLSYNNIQNLDLSDLYSSHNTANTANEILTVINITNNSIICDCSTESARFMEWFLIRRNYSRIQLFPNSITCGNYDSKVLTSYTTYRQIMTEKCENDHLELILGISIPIYIIICMLYIAALVCGKTLLKRWRERKYKTEHPRYAVVRNPRHAAFIAASSKDLEFVRNQLLYKLEEEIQPLINKTDNSDSELIVTGECIEVGKYVIDEIHELVSSSVCVIVILSKNFLKSEFCEYEFRCASVLKRRVILLYIQDCKEEISDKGASRFLKNQVRHYTYKQWPFLEDEEHVVEENKKQYVIKELAIAISNIYRENEENVRKENQEKTQIKQNNTVGEKAK